MHHVAVNERYSVRCKEVLNETNERITSHHHAAFFLICRSFGLNNLQ